MYVCSVLYLLLYVCLNVLYVCMYVCMYDVCTLKMIQSFVKYLYTGMTCSRASSD